jgi:hypothetical protein
MPPSAYALAIVNDLFDDILDAEVLDLMGEADLLEEEPPPDEDEAPPVLVH